MGSNLRRQVRQVKGDTVSLSNKGGTMSYAADGQLEPKFVDEVRQEFLPDVMGYRVLLLNGRMGNTRSTFTNHYHHMMKKLLKMVKLNTNLFLMKTLFN
jgi:hypothetical protein